MCRRARGPSSCVRIGGERRDLLPSVLLEEALETHFPPARPTFSFLGFEQQARTTSFPYGVGVIILPSQGRDSGSIPGMGVSFLRLPETSC